MSDTGDTGETGETGICALCGKALSACEFCEHGMNADERATTTRGYLALLAESITREQSAADGFGARLYTSELRAAGAFAAGEVFACPRCGGAVRAGTSDVGVNEQGTAYHAACGKALGQVTLPPPGIPVGLRSGAARLVGIRQESVQGTMPDEEGRRLMASGFYTGAGDTDEEGNTSNTSNTSAAYPPLTEAQYLGEIQPGERYHYYIVGASATGTGLALTIAEVNGATGTVNLAWPRLFGSTVVQGRECPLRSDEVTGLSEAIAHARAVYKAGAEPLPF